MQKLLAWYVEINQRKGCILQSIEYVVWSWIFSSLLEEISKNHPLSWTFLCAKSCPIFNQLGRNTGISIHRSQSFDSPLHILLNHFESTKSRILFVSKIAYFLRRYRWIWGILWVQKLLVKKHPRDFMPWDFLVTKNTQKI